MPSSFNKPKLSSRQLVQKMKIEKGITFNYTNERDAEVYLEDINNYFRTASYRKNYQKYLNGTNIGKYIKLDFAYLQELSTIDMHFRFLILKMCVDIEHALKVQLIKHSENSNEDGYQIVTDFLLQNPYILKSIEKTSSSPYTSDLISKNFTLTQSINSQTGTHENTISNYSNCPIWVLVELLSFGDFIRFYKYYYNTHNVLHLDTPAINLVRSLRNCCAHNNCIINNLSSRQAKAPLEISRFVSQVPNISSEQMKKKLKCRPILEFVALIYVYKKSVSSKVAFHRFQELQKFFYTRVKEKKSYFESNELLVSHYNFITKLLKFHLK